MRDRMVRLVGVVVGVAVATAAMVVGVLATTATPAEAQDTERYATCAAYNTILGTGGQAAIAAAEALRALGSPNPPGIEDALDIIVDFEDNAGSIPSNDQHEAAIDVLGEYFGPICEGLDVCPLVSQATATNDASSAQAARLLRGISTPAPPGIDAALALIAGDITVAQSPFHESVAEAQQQVREYFPCAAGGGLAYTGTGATAPLAFLGASLLAGGAAALAARRRLLNR